MEQLQIIAEKFNIQGKVISIDEIKRGYINRTYKIETLSENNHIHKYILQRINTNVFPDVESLMSNFQLTTEHLSHNLSMPGNHTRGTVQTLRLTKDGKPFLKTIQAYGV